MKLLVQQRNLENVLKQRKVKFSIFLVKTSDYFSIKESK